jgi:lipopolysaccharide/colanic/teichoic acid biosynthesis glycosyltransferase
MKRLVDIVFSGTLLLVLAPVIFVLAIAIKLDSRGPAFFRCRRVGKDGRELMMLKFRKMHDGAAGAPLAASDDDRFTRLGSFLARTKLDEIPQLWNVLRGQMSLVGPRPESPVFVDRYPVEYAEILTVRPGVTGYCQLAFARESEILDPFDREKHYVERILPQKIEMDRLYAARRTFGTDVRILWWTARAVLFSDEVAVHRETGRLKVRSPRTALGTVLVEESSG